jgi:hypothetical protein
MAGHYPLSKLEEPKLFTLVEQLLGRFNTSRKAYKPLTRNKIPHLSKQYSIMFLTDEYVENPINEFAVMFGAVSLESITDEHPSLVKNIEVEIHVEVNENKPKIKDIFWVA